MIFALPDADGAFGERALRIHEIASPALYPKKLLDFFLEPPYRG